MKNQGILERQAPHVIDLVLAGMTDEQVALALKTKRASVHPSAVQQFRARHAEELALAQQQAVQVVIERWIADKDQRLGKLQDIYAGLEDVKDTYGFMVTTEEAGGKEGERTIYDQHFNGALAAQMRGVLSDASEELGQKPRGTAIDLSDRRAYILQVVTNGDSVPLG